jgi:hypothetical protein
MSPRFLTLLIGRDLPQIQQRRAIERSIINEATVADFTRVVGDHETGLSNNHRTNDAWAV